MMRIFTRIILARECTREKIGVRFGRTRINEAKPLVTYIVRETYSIEI